MVSTPQLLPWQHETWSRIVESFDRLPHATLLSGSEGIGKFQLASRLAMVLLCDRDEPHPCGDCRGCRLFTASTHPDLHVITSEVMLDSMDSVLTAYSERYLDDSRARSKRKTVRTTILISQIRLLINEANTVAHISRNKVFVIAPVDAMTTSASNSLLKILEEPAPNNFLILVTENSQNLLPTIASRCQNIRMPDPDFEDAEQWLVQEGLNQQEIDAIKATGRGPLLGLRNARSSILLESKNFLERVIQNLIGTSNEDAVMIAEQGLKLGENECLYELHQLVSDLIRMNLTGRSQSKYSKANLLDVASRIDPRSLFSIYDLIAQLRQQIREGALDKTLAIEDVLLVLGSVASARN